ncbi:MAG: hypothetical protein FE047_02130 [Thermoplasmata archaeon]|nr:MAG: hypothetical protein FE047_02130 [Thermoplasmata archaeon]
MGYEKPKYVLDFIINIACLKIIDAYINDDQNEEWQYLWKEAGRSNIPIKNEFVEKHPLFNNETCRYITYGGGPGMYGVKKSEGNCLLCRRADENSSTSLLDMAWKMDSI